MSARRLLLAAIVVAVIGISLHTLAKGKNVTSTRPTSLFPSEGKFPPLTGATGWLNSPPLSVAGLRGKVVLIDFWTYSCINWRRSLPYVRAWAHKYQAQGLVVVGVHTPEFGFEKNVDNVRWATSEMKIDYPVALDRQYAIWRAFDNQYWPALYLIDTQGNVRYHQFGEGEYERVEAVIQLLLVEAGAPGVSQKLVSVEPEGAEAAPDWSNSRSPENYLGYERTQNFASLGGAVLNEPHPFEAPARLSLNAWALTGNWTMRKESALLNAAGGRIRYRFHARSLHLVMGPLTRGNALRFRVLVDGQPPGSAHGSDVDDWGRGTVREQRLYQLIRQTKPILDRLFEIEFLDPGAEAFSFTFS
ncbi:MAG: thioredoxin family protein [Polyangiaceae bacterium]